MINKYAGTCYDCGERVAVGEGSVEKIGEKWETRCNSCVGADSPTIRFELKENIRNTAIARPERFLVGEWFQTWRNACAHGGSRYWKDPDGENGGYLVTFDALPRLIKELRSAKFEISVDPLVKKAMTDHVTAAQEDDSDAAARLDELDAKLALEGKAAFKFQKQGTRWLAPRHGAILNDDMGLGKTMQALLSVMYSAAVVVVCPAIAKPVWLREIAKWRPDLKPVVLDGRKSFRWPEPGEVVIINYAIQPATAAEEDVPAGIPRVNEGDVATGTVIIGDEAQALKNNKSQQTKRFRAMADQVRKADGRVWLLTATAILNRPPELWALLIAAGAHHDSFSNFDRFKDMMGGRDGRFAIEWGKPAPACVELLRRVMLRRTKKGVMPDLPGKILADLTVEIDRKTTKICDAQLAELEAKGIDLTRATRDAIMSNLRKIHFEDTSTARKALAIAKIPAMLKFVEQCEQNDEPLVVFSRHRSPIDALDGRKGWAVVTGDTPQKRRGQIEDDFQAGKLRGVAGTIQAMGTAVTLTAAAQELFVDESYTPSENEQAQDRCLRIGQTRTVNITRLVANHRLDEGLALLCAQKTEIIDGSVDKAQVIDIENPTEALAAAANAVTESTESEQAAEDRRQQRDHERAARAAQMAADGRPSGVAGKRREALTARDKWAVSVLRRLAADAGFNSLDNEFGHSLAAQLAADGLTDIQWRAVIKLCSRYDEPPAENAADGLPF
jgi:hypothetical protein